MVIVQRLLQSSNGGPGGRNRALPWRRVAFGVALAIAGAGGGCVFGPDVQEPVAQSRSPAPEWSSYEAGHWYEEEGTLYYVASAPEVSHLPSSMKQVQLAALGDSERALESYVEDKLRAFAQIPTEDFAGRTEYQQLLTTVTRKVHGDHAQIADVYYEAHAKSSSGEAKKPSDGDGPFHVFALVELPARALAELRKDLAARLTSSQTPQLRQMGQALESSSGEQSP